MSDRHGRGVFATAHGSAGQVLEVCPALVMSRRDTAMMDATAVRDYVVAWDEARTAVAFGLLAMCNHDCSANAALEVHESPAGHAVSLVATGPIVPGQEVTIDYGRDHPVQEPS